MIKAWNAVPKPVYLYDLSVFCTLNFLTYEKEKKKRILNISSHILQCICFPVRNMLSSRFSVAHV